LPLCQEYSFKQPVQRIQEANIGGRERKNSNKQAKANGHAMARVCCLVAALYESDLQQPERHRVVVDWRQRAGLALQSWPPCRDSNSENTKVNEDERKDRTDRL
jgi:hypothetical protein